MISPLRFLKALLVDRTSDLTPTGPQCYGRVATVDIPNASDGATDIANDIIGNCHAIVSGSARRYVDRVEATRASIRSDLTPSVCGVNIRSLGNNFSPLQFPIFLFRQVSFC